MGGWTVSVSAGGTMKASAVPVMVSVRVVRVTEAQPAVAATSDCRGKPGNVVGL
jgi:hypothetical protein